MWCKALLHLQIKLLLWLQTVAECFIGSIVLLSPVVWILGLSCDAPLLPLTRTDAHFPGFGADSGVFHRAGRLPVIRVCLGPVRRRSGSAGPGSPLTVCSGGCSRRSGGPVTACALRAPRAAGGAAFTHSGHFERTVCAVSRSYLHRFGFLDGFSCRLHCFGFNHFCCWHFYFKVLSADSLYEIDASSSAREKDKKI